MIEVLVSVFALIAAVSVAYLLTIIDSIIHFQLYQYGLNFSYDWANPYWMFLRLSLALLGLIAVATSLNITYFFWKKVRKPVMARAAEKRGITEASSLEQGVPTLFQCTSCGRSITHPLRMLDFHSQRPKMINTCPFCNATVIPVNYGYRREEVSPTEKEEEEIEKRG